jgi:hypothetical protein
VRALRTRKLWQDPRYFFAGPTERQAKLIAWKDLIMLTPPDWLKGEPNHSELRIDTVFGSSLHVIGLDKPQRMEGPPWDGGVVDESCDVKPDAVKCCIWPTLVDRHGWLWRIGVPKRVGVGAAEYRRACEEAAAGGHPDEAEFHWPSKDIVPLEELRYFQERMDAKDYAEQFDASWQKAGGKIWHAFDEDYNVRGCVFDPAAPLVVGCDFNVDPMAWVLGHPRNGGSGGPGGPGGPGGSGGPPDGHIEWFDELWMRDTNTRKALDALWEKYGSKTRGTVSFYGDATSRRRETSASESDYLQIVNDRRFKAKGATVHFPKANPGKAMRFAAGNAVLRNAAGNVRCFFDRRMEHTLADIENRGYRPGTTEPDDKGDVGHATDAWSYACYMLYPIVEDAGGTRRVVIHEGELRAAAGRAKRTGDGRPPRAAPKARRRHARRR